MSNGLRHAIGAVVGLAVTPLVVLAMGWGGTRLEIALARFDMSVGTVLPGLAVVLVLGIVLGLVSGSRVSPLASLIPGAVLSLWGVLGSLEPTAGLSMAVVPLEYFAPHVSSYVLVGGLLLAASLPPSRWRAGARRTEAAPAGRPHGVPDHPPAPVRGPVDHGGGRYAPGTGPQPAQPHGVPGRPAAPPPQYRGGPRPGEQQPYGGPAQPAQAPYAGPPRRPDEQVPHLYGTGPIPRVPPAEPGAAPPPGQESHLYGTGTGPMPRITDEPGRPGGAHRGEGDPGPDPRPRE
ncbi:hypothetical protein HDA32_004829 [Spinactinospora alkalitolerans]|uniref:Uncharacterized protein n=1 Tax=Spinactinospora alkalitolerans TaxID=687207 RepID=A0A852U0D4_9ACTN|nr:hypothetical protein [Spinactinospora alkalitolerans]NYE49709.1 hypothetical protein [Spinactinospora alkalitolerans]